MANCAGQKLGGIWAKNIALFAFALSALVAPSPSFAHNGYDSKPSGISADETPKELEGIGIDEHLGSRVDLDLKFKDENGADISLRDMVSTHKPVLLSLAYFGCPSLCSYHINGLNTAFRDLKAPLGQEFEYVVISIDSRETSDLALKKRDAYIKAYGRNEGAKGWHFWTGGEENIRKIASQVGFKYRWDEEQKQWAHASAAYAITPDGRISRYLYGIMFDPKVLRLSMIEASNGEIGTIVDKLTLFCFHFDPKENKYTVAAFNIMRAGGGLTALILAAVLVPFWFRSRRNGERDGNVNNGVQGES
jgi:protein SCO1